MRGIRSSGGLWAVILLAVAATGCAGEGAADAGHPPVIVFLIDALRHDHLGVYGYERDTSPAIDAFAADAVVFEEAYSPTSWTKPATASLLLGVNPPRHGVQSRRHRVPQELPLLGEYFQAAGYRTRAVITNPHVSAHWGFDRGFDEFIDLSTDAEAWQATSAAEVNDLLFERLDQDRGEPFLYYVHTIDPHGPNDPKPPYDSLFVDDPREVPLPAALGPDTPSEVVDMMKALYDAEIYFSDEQFGALLDRLRELDIYDDALIVLLSDHGEEHLDHGQGGHGKQLFQELVRIPLIVKFPGNRWAGTRVEQRASLIDVLPTLLGAIGLETPPLLEGVDLAAAVAGEGEIAPRPLFFDLNQVRHDGTLHVSRGVLDGRYKFIEQQLPGQQRWLFDLVDDPAERTNLAERSPEEVERLDRILREYEIGVSEEAVPEHLREQLRALGYIN